jgi:hypothetical protein
LVTVLWGFTGAVEAVVLPLAQAGQAEASSEQQRSVPLSAATGLPFRLAPGISAAGYGLNTNNDGVQNFGEVGIDCGGAGARSCVDIKGPRSHLVMTTGGGQVAIYAVQGSASRIDPVPQRVVDIAGTQTSLATGYVSGRAVVAVGSWLRNADGHSLHLLDASTLTPIAAIPAGYVMGTALVDLDGDDSDEVIVGTQDGWLRVYSPALELLFEWSAGGLSVGVNGALFAVKTSQGARAAFAVSGGFQVVEISR